jgi:glycosyltransferase 2 family protein
LGVFETVTLYLLPHQIPANEALGSLLAYRGIYFLLPLFVALIWLGIYEIKKKLLNRV